MQGHSYGGLVAQHLLLDVRLQRALSGRLAGVALLASLPPTGYAPVLARISAGGGRCGNAEPRVIPGVPTDTADSRRKYFSPDLPADIVRGYTDRLLVSSRVRLVDLSVQEPPPALPSQADEGRGGLPPVLVLCGDGDFIIDAVREEELAHNHHASSMLLPRLSLFGWFVEDRPPSLGSTQRTSTFQASSSHVERHVSPLIGRRRLCARRLRRTGRTRWSCLGLRTTSCWMSVGRAPRPRSRSGSRRQ